MNGESGGTTGYPIALPFVAGRLIKSSERDCDSSHSHQRSMLFPSL